jgi:dCTP diphosphatase
MADDLRDLQDLVRRFAAEREWEQFHTPKNLAMAIAGEAGELVAELQWLTPGQIETALVNGTLRERLSSELADVLIYLVRLADVCRIDLIQAALAKVEVNRARYPVDRARGNAKKYTALEE